MGYLQRLFGKVEIPKRTKPSAVPRFEEMIENVTAHSHKAQATFCFKLVNSLDKSVLKTLAYYANSRLKHGDTSTRPYQPKMGAKGTHIWNDVSDINGLESLDPKIFERKSVVSA